MSKVESKSVLERLFGLEMTPRDISVHDKTDDKKKTKKVAKKSAHSKTAEKITKDVVKAKKVTSKAKK